MDGRLREHLRYRLDESCRRQLGAELDDCGLTHLPEGPRQSLAFASWEATQGDPLGALCLALDALAARASREAA